MKNNKLKNSGGASLEDTKIIVTLIVTLIFFIWIFMPPLNKILQIMSWGNNIYYYFAKTFNASSVQEYIYHKNNAIYLAKMYPEGSSKALAEINKAIDTAPKYIPKAEMDTLYTDRAKIKLFAGDKKGALSDFMKSEQIDFVDKLPVAILLAENKRYRSAMNLCNEILEAESNAFSGYACLAEVYNQIGKTGEAINIYDMVLDRKKNVYWAYIERGKLKLKLNDNASAEKDFAKAKEYAPRISKDDSYFAEALSPKYVVLKIQ